ncbi:MAG: hypothetical protein QOF21_679 [Actinomycetota bacterium]
MVGDAELAVAAAAGDRAALGQIYDRYADTLYELCRVILRDPHEANDAVHDTFVIAATRLAGLREKDRLKPWLCAIARHESFRRSSKRARSRRSHDEVLDVAVADNTADRLFGSEAANLVWSAAVALTDRERVVLELNVRQGLDGAELAEAAGLTGATASVVLSRAKTQLGVAVRCLLLVRYGRAACSELAGIAPASSDAFDGLTRKRVARHAVGCANCEPRWNASPDALGILGVAPLLGVPAALKSKVLDDPRLISTSRPLGGRGWQGDGFPPMAEKRRRRPLLTSAAAALALAVVATALVLAGNNDRPKLAAPDEIPPSIEGITQGSIVTYGLGAPVTTPAGEILHNADGSVATIPPGTPKVDANGAFITTPPQTGGSNTTAGAGGGSPTTGGSGATTPTSNPASGGTTTPATAAPTTTTAPLTIETTQPRYTTLSLTGCEGATNPDRTEVFASASKPDIQLWLHTNVSSTAVRMVSNPSDHHLWNATLGPFSGTGTVTWWVSNTSGTGGIKSDSRQVTVDPCPQ